MKITINAKNALEIDLWELSDSLTDEQRELFAKYVVFRETLITGIVDTIASGDAYEGGWWVGGMADKLRQKLLPIMPEAMQKLVKSLLQQRDDAKAEVEKYRTTLARLELHWPMEVPAIGPCSTPANCSCRWTDDMARSFLVTKLGENWQEQIAPAEPTS